MTPNDQTWMKTIDKAMQNTLMIIIMDTEKENGINIYTLVIMIMTTKVHRKGNGNIEC